MESAELETASSMDSVNVKSRSLSLIAEWNILPRLPLTPRASKFPITVGVPGLSETWNIALLLSLNVRWCVTFLNVTLPISSSFTFTLPLLT